MRGIHTCCPEAPSIININQNIIQMDGETAFFVDERFSGQAAQDQVITLSHTPYAAASVLVSLNSGVQRPVADYVVVGDQVRFNFTPNPEDSIHIRYFSKESGAMIAPSGSEMPVGFTMGYSGTPIPDGWLTLNTDVTVSEAAFPDLYAFLTNNMHLVEETIAPNDDYRLKTIMTPYYTGGQMLSGATIIKA